MGIAYFAVNNYRDSDPRYSLLVSQALITEGTTRLDSYAELLGSDYRAVWHDEHVYYAYPPGPSLFSVPVVWVAWQLGYDMSQAEDDHALQRVISALLAGLIVLLLYLLAREFLSPLLSLVLAASMMWSTLLISTVGSALWNGGYLVALELLVLWLVVGAPKSGEQSVVRGGLIGFCLWGAFLTRPTAALFIIIILAYLFFWQRELFWSTAVVAGGGLLLWVALNYGQIGQPLPNYYIVNNAQTFGQRYRAPWWYVLYSSTFGPSRGVFIYSPLLLLALLTAVVGWCKREGTPRWLMGGMLLWIVGLLLFITRFDVWWGGIGFGPRLQLEMMPAFALLLAWSWPTAVSNHRLWYAALAILTLSGIYINSYAGLYDPFSREWNGVTILPINEHAMMYDWRYPQFWMSHDRLCQRSVTYQQWYAAERVEVMPILVNERFGWFGATRHPELEVATWYQPPWQTSSSETTAESDIAPDPPLNLSPRAYLPVAAAAPDTVPKLVNLFGGWGIKPEDNAAVVVCAASEIIFGAVDELDRRRPLALYFELRSWGEQEVFLSLNGHDLAPFSVDTETMQGFYVPIEAAYLHSDEVNHLTWHTPNAVYDYNRETWQTLGLQMWQLTYTD